MKQGAGVVCVLFLVLCSVGVGAADTVAPEIMDDTERAGDMYGFSHGPYLTGMTTNETVVNWRGTIPVGGTVAYATDTFYRETGGYDQQVTDDAAVALHRVRLTGLEPGTCYHYTLTVGGEPSGDHTFKTFPEKGPFTFIVYGDTQEQLPYFTQAERHALVAERIAANEPDALFVMHVGDTVCAVDDAGEWDRFFTAGSTLFADMPIMPVLGNHENNATIWYDTFGMPEWYSFDCGDAHFVVLDSNDWATPHMKEETAWLRANLKENQDRNPAGRTFVSFHHPPYSSGTRHPGGWTDIRALWVPVLEEYQVDMVFNGHVHAYQRYAVNGIHYVIAATGGGMMYDLTRDKAEGYAASADHELGYVRVTVDDDRVTSVFVPVAAVSADSRAVTGIVSAGTEYDPVVIGGCDGGIFRVFKDLEWTERIHPFLGRIS